MPLTSADIELMAAVRSGIRARVEEALEHGANIFAHDDRTGYVALTEAIVSNHLHIAQLLVEWGADVNAADAMGWTPLMRAAHGGQLRAVYLLLKSNADTEREDENQQTALTLAQWGGCGPVIDMLMKWPDVQPPPAADELIVRLAARPPSRNPFGPKGR